MSPNEIETPKLLVTEVVPRVLIAAAVLLGPWLLWAWVSKLLRRVPVSGSESKIDNRRVIAELEPLINRYGAFLEANAHLLYAIPASKLETAPQELKAMLLRYGSALRDCNLLDEQTRQILRNGYCELSRVLPEAEGNDKDSSLLDKIAAEENDEKWKVLLDGRGTVVLRVDEVYDLLSSKEESVREVICEAKRSDSSGVIESIRESFDLDRLTKSEIDRKINEFVACLPD